MANNFVNLRPTLNLDMVNGIYVDPRVTFTRAGTRTFFGREMVKAEENLFLNSVWAGAVSGTPGTVPTSWTSVLNGGSLAVSGAAIEFTALTGTRQAIGQTITVVAGDVLTFSMDVDAVTGTGTDALAIWEVVSGAVLSGSTKILVSGGTGRKTSSTTVTTGGTVRVRVGASVEVNATTDCVATLKAPQIERRSFATAYTPTTTQPITRYQRLLKTAAANEWPREFDPVTGECLGRSVWESRTNLLQRSEEFDNAYWTKSNTTISPNQVIAPDGTLSADIATTTSTADGISRALTGLVANGTYTVSVPIKVYSGATWFRFVLFDSVSAANRVSGWFNAATGAVGSATNGGTGTGATVRVVDFGNGFYRFILTGAVNNSVTSLTFQMSTATADLSTTGVSGVSYIPWGAQLE